MTKPHVTAERLRELFSYDPERGILSRLVPRNGTKTGPIPGTLTNRGYLQISADNRRYYVHRIAWMISHGEIPDGLYIDHVNGNRSDNRLANLRLLTIAENCQNRHGVHRSREGGILGVDLKRGKWRARINIGGRQVEIGLFPTQDEASEAYLKAKREMHPAATI